MEPANFYREKPSAAFVTGHLFDFFGGFISHLFGDYVNINMGRSDHMKALPLSFITIVWHCFLKDSVLI